MRVKVGDTWYESAKGQPVMVELTEEDKKAIASLVGCPQQKYATFQDDDPEFPDKEAMFDWME